jgi:GWxTD domain-containing protein
VIPWVTPIWLAGVVLFTLKNLLTWFGSRRIRWSGVCAVAEHWQERLNNLRGRLGISKPVELLESCMTQIPVVIGHIRPVILLPIGLVSGLPTEQIEMILMHELAHVRRHDYLVNLLQTVVESVLFFNPAALWISKKIRNEREHCCDDDIVRITKDPGAYAATLIALEAGRAAPAETAIAATGGTLVTRIRRLLYPNETVSLGLVPVVIGAVLVVATSLMLAAHPATPKPQPEVPKPVPVAETSTPVVTAPRELVRQTAVPSPSPTKSPEIAPALKKWLDEDVAYIITPQEREAFRNLPTDEEREHFIESFWLRRDPTPGTVENEYREENQRRINYANDKFGTSSGVAGWKTDRGRVYILFGPPDEIESHPSGGTYQRPDGGTTRTFPFDIWKYRYIEGFGKDVLLEFVDPRGDNEFRLSIDPAFSARLSIAGPVPILGAVRAAGVYIVQGPGRLLDMLAMAQGVTADAVEIQITRGRGSQQQKIRIPVEEFLTGRSDLNVPVFAGDRIDVLTK